LVVVKSTPPQRILGFTVLMMLVLVVVGGLVLVMVGGLVIVVVGGLVLVLVGGLVLVLVGGLVIVVVGGLVIVVVGGLVLIGAVVDGESGGRSVAAITQPSYPVTPAANNGAEGLEQVCTQQVLPFQLTALHVPNCSHHCLQASMVAFGAE